jgi:hypothetical protein
MSEYTFEELKQRQKKGKLEKEIAKENDWVLEIGKANIWEGNNSIKCPHCKDNLSASWHIDAWPNNRNWNGYDEATKASALIRFPRGIMCFQCGCVIQMYRNDNAVRTTNENDEVRWVVE